MNWGSLKNFKNMGIIPLSSSVNHDPEYITLKEALEKNQLTVKEVSHSGSVPELKVINKADIHILLLDGEELVGAKQNLGLSIRREESCRICSFISKEGYSYGIL